MRKLDAIMAGIALVGAVAGLLTLCLSTTPAAGLTWSAMTVLDLMLAGQSARDAIHGW